MSDREHLSMEKAARNRPYIGQEPLRLLARMIARDILRKSASFDTKSDVARPTPQEGTTNEVEKLPKETW